MSKEIKAGDLVQVVKKSPCGCQQLLGHPFVVKKICTFSYAACTTCGDSIPNLPLAMETDDEGFPIECLIKIDPPPTKEDIASHFNVVMPA